MEKNRTHTSRDKTKIGKLLCISGSLVIFRGRAEDEIFLIPKSKDEIFFIFYQRKLPE